MEILISLAVTAVVTIVAVKKGKTNGSRSAINR